MTRLTTLIRRIFPAPQPEPPVDPLTRARNENSAALAVERNTTRRQWLLDEQRRLTTAALRRGM